MSNRYNKLSVFKIIVKQLYKRVVSIITTKQRFKQTNLSK